MKYLIAKLTTATLLAAFIVSGCDGPQNQNRVDRAQTSQIEAERDLDIAKTEVEAEYRIYKIENENRLMRYERAIAQNNDAIRNGSTQQVRDKLQARLDEHERAHRSLQREMTAFRTSGRESWKDFRDSFSNRMDALGDSLSNFPATSRTATR
jgi:predicted  nucleic acid-binding Zn-ribbon protein